MSVRRSTRNGGHVPVVIAERSITTAATSRKRKLATQSTDQDTALKKSKQVINKTSIKVPLNDQGPPTTPARQRKSPASSKLPKAILLTPTPSLVGVLRAPYSSGDIDDATPPPESTREANPYVTNAPLITPGGSRKTAFPSQSRTAGQADLSPTKQPTTTDTLLDKAQAHLISVDPRFKELVAKHRCAVFAPEGLAEEIDPFRSLTSGICGQQVSGAAAKAIKNKFVALFNEGNEGVHVWPSTATVAQTSIEHLRTAGLSQRKAEYIQGLAEKFTSGELSTKMLLQASDEEVMEKLIAVRGLGKWSVEM